MHRLLVVTLVLACCGLAAADQVEDPYLWLEEIEGEKALSWAKERSAKDTAILEAVPVFAEIHEKLLAGASWMAEYGNPDTEDWAYIKT